MPDALVVVVGAGLAGLHAAWPVRQAGIEGGMVSLEQERSYGMPSFRY